MVIRRGANHSTLRSYIRDDFGLLKVDISKSTLWYRCTNLDLYGQSQVTVNMVGLTRLAHKSP